jgi:hypothetical protein
MLTLIKTMAQDQPVTPPAKRFLVSLDSQMNAQQMAP